MDGFHGLGMRKVSSYASIAEDEDLGISKLLEIKPKLTIERQRLFDERSMSGLDGGFENVYSPSMHRSGFDTPASSCRDSFEPHPMIADAWESLRRSLVYFRGQPVGTVAACDHASEEVLNYDQIRVWENRNSRGLLVFTNQDLTKKFGTYFYVSKGTDGILYDHFCYDKIRSTKVNDIIKRVVGGAVPVFDGETFALNNIDALQINSR